jgi:hypothetical protein
MAVGVDIITTTAALPKSQPTATDGLFVVGPAPTGNLTQAVECRSMNDVETSIGVRGAGNQLLYDSLDVFFREGGRRAVVGAYNTPGTIDTALANFPKQLGPGQVSAPAEAAQSATVWAKLLDHAAANNRFALLDPGDNQTQAQLVTAGGTFPTSNPSYGMLCGPRVIVPAPANVVAGVAREVPPSGVIAALIARADGLGNPNRAAAGKDFPLQYATDLESDFVGGENTLLNAKVNPFVQRYGVMQAYGFQTGVVQDPNTAFWQANASRTRMWLVAKAAEIGENYMFKPIDGRGILLMQLKSDLEALCKDLWEVNGLYGEEPSDAYSVVVSSAINTTDTIAQGELHASVEVRLTLHAKRVIINLITVPLTGVVSQAA